MSKKVYTEKDIYEGMVLECVESEASYWTVGKQYIVDNDLDILDDDEDFYWNVGEIVDLLNDGGFKVVEPKEKHGILQLFNYTFGIKDGDVEEVKYYLGNQKHTVTHEFNKKHITVPAYNTQQAIEYLTNELDYEIKDIVSLEVK